MKELQVVLWRAGEEISSGEITTLEALQQLAESVVSVQIPIPVLVEFDQQAPPVGIVKSAKVEGDDLIVVLEVDDEFSPFEADLVARPGCRLSQRRELSDEKFCYDQQELISVAFTDHPLPFPTKESPDDPKPD